MSEDNITQILVAAIPALISGVITLIIAYKKPVGAAEIPPPVGASGTPHPAVPVNQPSKLDPVRLNRALLWGIGIGLAVGLLVWLLLNLIKEPPKELPLWRFDQNTEAWQPEKQDAKPEAAATRVSWNARGFLQGEFDFSQVNPENLSGDMAPRATYYIDPVQKRDWSAFQTLTFDIENQSTHALEVYYSISNETCWYEFGGSQALPPGQTSSLRFNLNDELYKTCFTNGGYNQPPATFDDVWRFDIIVGTPEDPWHEVKGSILIDNIKLTDRITP